VEVVPGANPQRGGAGAAVQQVVALAAIQQVGSQAAQQRIRTGGTLQRVGITPAQQPLRGRGSGGAHRHCPFGCKPMLYRYGEAGNGNQPGIATPGQAYPLNPVATT
jgi:hypothetical protein